jgi:two-component system, cell cycle sensor histidine kinase and response regulator CckA
MEQILLNLGTNAADAMPEGGRLTIRTSNVTLDEQPCLTCGETFSGLHVAVSVSDNGQGMDEQTIEHIFEPFYTTKELGRGTGLGLSTVHGIVTSHGGHITCASAPGQGTTFTLFFPVMQSAIDDLPGRQPLGTQPGGHETILLVDDEQALLELGSRILELAGYTVRRASTGEQALQVFSAEGPKPDLVVMDLGMPGMGGKKAMEELLFRHPGTKVVIASGYGASGKVKEALASGASGYVAKPYHKANLLHSIRELLDKR